MKPQQYIKEKIDYLLRPHRAVAIGAHRGIVLARRFAIGAAFISLFIYWMHPPLLERVDIRIRDLVFQLREAPPPPPEVVIVSVDEKSVKTHGLWPWPRAKQGELIARLKELGAKAIGLDIIYALPQDERNNQILTDALQRSGPPVIGGYFFRDEQIIRSSEESIDYIRSNKIAAIMEKPDARRDTVANYPFVEGVHADLAPDFSAFGYFNTVPDYDGLIRSAPLVLRYENNYYPSLAIQTLAKAYNQPLAIEIDIEGIAGIRLGRDTIPVNAMGKLALNFYNPERPIPLISASDILDGTAGAEAIRDKVVFIGATEPGIADVRPTPIDHSFPGVGIHATIAANIIQDFYLYHDNLTVLVDVLLMAVLPFLMVWVMSLMDRPLFMTGVFLSTSAIVWFIFYTAVSAHGLLISFFYPVIAILIGYTIFEMYEILVTQRRNRYIRRAFSSYISPSLVKKIIREPGALKLTGETRDITVLFSDIRGFTTISEAMSPEQLVLLLNNYLGPMTEIVIEEGGTLDKYIGDAVMAIFNAPLDHPDHAMHASRTAIKMQNALKELNKEFQQQFAINMRIGIGLHTGDAVVGNMGSPRRFNYTAMGDTVNLASRLEGQTKYYGVDIIITESTRKNLNDEFTVRCLDKIRVKGKLQPVEIFHLFSDGATNGNIDLSTRFDEAVTHYYDGNFSKSLQLFEEIYSSYPEDKPTELFIERCRHLIENPPEEWDGVHVATSK